MSNCTLYMLNNRTPLFTITHHHPQLLSLGPKPAQILAHLWSFRRLLALFLQWIWKDLQIRSSLFQWACWWINHLPAIEIKSLLGAIRSWIRCGWHRYQKLIHIMLSRSAKICQVSKLVAFLLPCASSGCYSCYSEQKSRLWGCASLAQIDSLPKRICWICGSLGWPYYTPQTW